MAFFKEIKVLEGEIRVFFNVITDATLQFNEAIREYLDDQLDHYEDRLNVVKALEQKADDLRREIRYKLYSDMLIPESRGDVLGLLENSDSIIDQITETMIDISIERPEFPKDLRSDLMLMANNTVKTVDHYQKAVNAFFDNKGNVSDEANHVYFFEEEVDAIEQRLKRDIYQSEVVDHLALKNQLRMFVEKIADISDIAQDVCERLSVSAIKRAL